MSNVRFEGTDSYVATDELTLAVNAAISLQRPLLIKGEPGTGKTMLALEVARALKIHSELKLRMGVNSGPVMRIADINANSNLRPSVAAAFGFDPFERVVDYLERRLAATS